MRRRAYRRSTRPTLGFFPLGLAGLALTLGAAVLGVLRAAWIEEDVRRSVRLSLLDAELDWVRFDVAGRHVRLFGRGPTGERRLAAEVASSARAHTWWGPMVAPAHVKSELAPSSPREELYPAESFLRLRLLRGAAEMSGRVGTERERSRLAHAALSARSTLPRRTFVETLEVSDAASPPGFLPRAVVGIEALFRCSRGELRVEPERGHLECLVSSAEAESVRLALEGRAGVTLVLAEEAARCERRLGALLERQPLAFGPGEAALRPASAGALEAYARAIDGCTGRVEVVGFAKAGGAFPSPRALGLARALTVVRGLVEAGAPGAKLVPVGSGEAPFWGTPSWRIARPGERVAFHVAVGPLPAERR